MIVASRPRMRILVTGSRGYIGALLVPMLKARGHDVFGLDSSLYADCVFGQGAPAPALPRDIRDVAASELGGYQAVIHLAALSNDPLSELEPALTRDINHRGAVALASASKAAGVGRFVFASSCSVYGNAGEAWVDEGTEPAPLTTYAAAKLAAERGILTLADAGFCPVVLRPGTAYGDSPMIRFDLVLNNLVAWAVTAGEVRVKSDGTSWRPMVHAADIALALLCACEAPAHTVHAEVFNVGRTQDNLQVRDIAAGVASLVPGSRLVLPRDAARDARSYRVDCSKAERALPGYAPAWTIGDGIREVLASCQRSPLRAGEFEGARFGRVAHLKSRIASGSVDATLRPAGLVAAAFA